MQLTPIMDFSNLIRPAFVAFGVALAGCAANAPPPAQSASTTGAVEPAPLQAPEPGSGMKEAQAPQACPMSIPGTTVSTADVPSGVAVRFTTTSGGQVAALRARVRAMASARGSSGCDCPSMHDSNVPAPAVASVEDLAGGAALVYRADDPTRVAALRQQINLQFGTMRQGGCNMVAEH